MTRDQDPKQSIEVVLFWPDGQYEVRLPAVPRVGDEITDKDGRGRVTAVEWNIENIERPVIGIRVDPVEQ